MKVLVIHASAGAGHRKAAEALYHSLKSSTGVDVVIVDALDYTNRFYKYLYSGTYTFVITYVPWLWGLLFRLIDIPLIVPLVRGVRRIYNSINASALAGYLKRENFDYIISTHFFPNEVAAYLKRKGKINSKIISAITDFDVHSIWLSEGIDFYAAACEQTRRKLLSLGIDGGDIMVTGIPTDTKFSSHTDMRELKQRLGLKEDVFTVLVATGSFGIGPIEDILQALPDFQVLVVCGHNQVLRKRLIRMGNDFAKIYGLVDNMDELMAVSDVMVTKPGGLSISEALVSGLPLIFFNAIPGQETNNVKVLKEHGIGLSGLSVQEMAQVLRRFQSSPEELRTAREKIKFLAKPSAVKDIIACVKGGRC